MITDPQPGGSDITPADLLHRLAALEAPAHLAAHVAAGASGYIAACHEVGLVPDAPIVWASFIALETRRVVAAARQTKAVDNVTSALRDTLGAVVAAAVSAGSMDDATLLMLLTLSDVSRRILAGDVDPTPAPSTA